jgi:hypothetical protein
MQFNGLFDLSLDFMIYTKSATDNVKHLMSLLKSYPDSEYIWKSIVGSITRIKTAKLIEEVKDEEHMIDILEFFTSWKFPQINNNSVSKYHNTLKAYINDVNRARWK